MYVHIAQSNLRRASVTFAGHSCWYSWLHEALLTHDVSVLRSWCWRHRNAVTWSCVTSDDLSSVDALTCYLIYLHVCSRLCLPHPYLDIRRYAEYLISFNEICTLENYNFKMTTLHFYNHKINICYAYKNNILAIMRWNSTIEIYNLLCHGNIELDILCNTKYLIRGVAEIIHCVPMHKIDN